MACLKGSGSEELTTMLAMNNDCLEATLDYLSLRDLVHVYKTCTQLQEVAGQFFEVNFPSRAFGKHGDLLSEHSVVKINCFSPHVQRIFMDDGNLSAFNYNRFQALKEIEFYRGSLKSIEFIANVLPTIETLKFIHCELVGDLYKRFLRHCRQLKRLYVRDNYYGEQGKILIGTSNSWLAKTYPSLTHFEIYSQRKIDQVIHFLQTNNNICKFSTTLDFLVQNWGLISKSGIKLDVLSIFHAYNNVDANVFNPFVQQLMAKQKNGLFQQLHLYFHCTREKYVYPQDALPLIKIWHAKSGVPHINLSRLNNLDQLYISNTSQIIDLNATLIDLKKLNYIYFASEKLVNVLNVMKCLPKLKQIQIDTITNGIYFNEDKSVLDLAALNGERTKLKYSIKLTVYVKENVYVATKKAFKNTKFNLIEVKRQESYAGFHDFSAFYDVLV